MTQDRDYGYIRSDEGPMNCVQYQEIVDMHQSGIITLESTGQEVYYNEIQPYSIWRFSNTNILMKVIPYHKTYGTPMSYVDFYRQFGLSTKTYIEPNRAAEMLMDKGINIIFNLSLFQPYTYVSGDKLCQ